MKASKLKARIMKVSIQTKLILAFLAVIVVPIVITFGSMWIQFMQLDKKYDLEELDHLQYVHAELRDLIVDAYPLLADDIEQFSRLIEEKVEPYNIEVEIVSQEGILLYSGRSEENLRAEEADSWAPLRSSITNNTMTVSVDERTNLKVIVHFSPTSMPSQIIVSVMKVIGISILLGFLSLIIVIGTFTWFISRSILRPLNELDRATKQVSKGEFDFAINYHKDNEFGRLVTAFTLMKDKLKEATDIQVEQEQLRKQLVANISHDIRTPVASIKGYVEGIQDGIVKNQAQLEKYLSVIHDKTDQLDRLVDDLYQYSQFEVGKMDVILHEYNCKDLFSSLARQFEVQFEAGQPQLTINDVSSPEGHVKVDKQRLLQVMENLIGNANRYIDANTGKIKITIEKFNQQYECDNSDEHFVKISIEDNGRGISAEDLPNVFDQFYRGEKSRSREFGGTGLGLSISKYIIEAHGGTIWIVSEIDHGTAVHFTLPIVLSNQC